MILRIYWKLAGEHVHMRVFSGRNNTTFALAGTLVLSAAEFLELTRGDIRPEFYEEVKGETR